MNNQEKSELLFELKEEILESLRKAETVLRGMGIIERRATSYWSAHIRMALDNEHQFLGGSTITMQDTIDELFNVDSDDEIESSEEE